MSLFDFFFDRILYQKKSKLHGSIEVIVFQGQKKLVAGGLMQSGDWIRKMWEKPLRQIQKTQKKPPTSILLLGLGGGTILDLLEKYWPETPITAVEIDQDMIAVARQYFDLDKHSQVKVLCDDAFHYIAEHKQPFDLIIVDLFCGDQVHAQVSGDPFMKNCYRLLRDGGIIVVNFLFYGRHKESAEKFVNKAGRYFNNINLIRSRWNLFVVAKEEKTI